MKRALSLYFLLLIIGKIHGQDISVTSAPDTSSILIGDQIHFIVSASINGNEGVNLQQLTDTLAGKIIILGKPVRDTVRLTGNKTKIEDKYLITAFDSGTYTIPPFYAELKSGDSIHRYYSDYSRLRVIRPDTTPADTTDVIFDIVPPRKAPVKFSEILPWLILFVVMAIIIWALAKFLPRNPLRRFIRPAPPAEPAHVVAFRELEILRSDELWQKGEIKEYYSRLSDILRRYIDGRYSIMSPELTTDETVRMLQKASVLKQDELTVIKDVLSLSDMVKFAKYIPQEEVHSKAFDDSYRFVEMTRMPAATSDTPGEKKGGDNA